MSIARPNVSSSPGLPGRYLAAGLGAFVLFAVGVPILAPDLVVTNDDPRVFALTHLAVLGWITMTMFGALCHQQRGERRELGLVYRLDVTEGEIDVEMTLTTPGCPLSDSMLQSGRCGCCPESPAFPSTWSGSPAGSPS